ncbi:carboxypeptidase regulatory-like domain-containing protein [candidate division KSB1 bacterium]|nr:carboxypeptidase regulatory-like domain-containing protein [candidate division KSB1 bacterium]
MKKFTTFFLLLLLIPSFVFSVNNAKINGQKEIVITQLPAEMVFTCDLARAGNKLAFEYYVDIDGDGQIGPAEEIQEFFYVTDGIGWIRDSEDPDSDLAGDETAVDGKLKVTFPIEAADVYVPTGIFGMLKVVDEDGSTDMVKVKIQVEPQPPFIQGKVTDANTGAAIQNVFVTAVMDDDTNFGITDASGNYRIAVSNGTYIVAAMEFPMVNYQMSDSATVNVSNNQSVTQDFQLQPFTTFVQGKLSKEDGTPVPGILVIATGGTITDFSFSMAVSDNQGNYKMGVKPGLVAVGANALYNPDNENWPADFYVDPAVDSLNVTEGQTATSNFVFKPYSSFVSGKCMVNGTGLAGVQISGFSFDFTTMQIYFYEAYSNQNGDYRMGVHPGTLTSLTAAKEGYEVTSPIGGGYMQVEVGANQTVTGKDFEFSPYITMPSISGTVTFNDGSPASNVYVVAENYWKESPEGFLITYTDGSGNYLFDNVLDGDYQVGVYYEGYSSNPEMIYFDLYAPMTGQDFVLSQGTAVESNNRILKPLTINLAQNFPNPFNPTTTISFDLPAAAQVEINIFNAAGQKIRTLVNRSMSAGLQQVEWDSRNDAGQKVTSGVYLYQLKTNNYTKVMKMILAK